MLIVIKALDKVLENLLTSCYDLCMHALGCRVVQKLIECIPSEFLNN